MSSPMISLLLQGVSIGAGFVKGLCLFCFPHFSLKNFFLMYIYIYVFCKAGLGMNSFHFYLSEKVFCFFFI